MSGKNIETKNEKEKIKTAKSRTARVYGKGDDLFVCSRCGNCLAICPIYRQTLDEGFAPRGKLSLIEAVVNDRIEFTEKLSDKIYTCTMCNYCTSECPSGVKVSDLFKAVRSDLVDNKKYPEILDLLKDRIQKAYNVTFDTNQGRLDWLKQIPGTEVKDYLKDSAEVVYFVGCVSSFSPRSFVIPRSIIQIFDRTGVDFTLLGEDEWCCGFPLLSSGMSAESVLLAKHNIEKIRAKDAGILITSCPSCYHTWKHEYEEITGEKLDFEILHVSQYLHRLIKEGKINPGRLDLKVTYHDPCDLGRSSGVYEEPREVIRSIPGIEFVELPNKNKQANCCGGGGNLESLNPGLAAKVAAAKAEEVISTGAEVIVSACQQCERTMSTALKKKKNEIDYRIRVLDISEIVLESMNA